MKIEPYIFRCAAVVAVILTVYSSTVSAVEDAADIRMLSLPTSDTIERADLFYWTPSQKPKAVLILCPGKNGNGQGWLKEEKWRKFAEEHHLLLCGLWFVSQQKTPLPNYSMPSHGSGQLLLDAMKQLAAEKLPMLLFGFSAGARFSASFVDSHPDRVLTWCGYSVGDWVPLMANSQSKPGIVAAGELDASSFWASLQYFQQGRKQGRNWTWVSAPTVGHQRSPKLEDFVRQYFAWHLRNSEQVGKAPVAGEWRDIGTKKSVTDTELRDYPAFSAWLPDVALVGAWEKLHHP